METYLNIVALNVPYPPNYGGIIDAYYRIKALNNLGVKIHLHCFDYGRGPSQQLEQLCASVTYYKRSSGIRYQLSFLPYIVKTRLSDELVYNLAQNNFPILFEGLHTTFCLSNPQFKTRVKIVRAHNIEHQYYYSLASLERKIFKKIFFLAEAIKLKFYEKILKKADYIMCVSHTEHEYFEKRYGSSVLIPSSHPYNLMEVLTGKGDYILFHGDLSVIENEIVAIELINKVFSKLSFNCFIAGKNPSVKVNREASRYQNVRIIANPSDLEMNGLIKNAHIHVLPVLRNNGLKLKLLLSLYAGRHCLVNQAMVDGTFLSSLCNVVDNYNDMVLQIEHLMNIPFTAEIIAEREKVLGEYYNNTQNAQKLIALLK